MLPIIRCAKKSKVELHQKHPQVIIEKNKINQYLNKQGVTATTYDGQKKN